MSPSNNNPATRQTISAQASSPFTPEQIQFLQRLSRFVETIEEAVLYEPVASKLTPLITQHGGVESLKEKLLALIAGCGDASNPDFNAIISQFEPVLSDI
jgi:hypothetical protein